MKANRKRILIYLLGCMIFGGFLWMVLGPSSSVVCMRNVCVSNFSKGYVLKVPGVDTLYFKYIATDSSLVGLSTNRDSAYTLCRSNAFFISYSGRVVTVGDTVASPLHWERNDLLPCLKKEYSRIALLQDKCRALRSEVAYYKHTHTVVDEGYHAIMELNGRLEKAQVELARKEECLSAVLKGKEAVADLWTSYELCMQGYGDARTKIACKPIARGTEGIEIWQTIDQKLPEGVIPFRLAPWPYEWFRLWPCKVTLWGFWDIAKRPVCVVPKPLCVRLKRDEFCLPMLDAARGAPVLGRCGHLVGLCGPTRFYSARLLCRLQWRAESWWEYAGEELRAWSQWIMVRIKRMCS